MIEELRNCPLFKNMKNDEISFFLKENCATIITYKKDDIIFEQGEKPLDILILLSGSLAICNDSLEGKRSIIAIFKNSGELFGEIFLFLKKQEYEHYALSLSNTEILKFSKEILLKTNNRYNEKVLANMLEVFAQKTYYLNKRVQILSASNLRQKIIRFILQQLRDKDYIDLDMNREELADFLNTTRPSLSRELAKMQDEGLIELTKNRLVINSLDELI